MEREISPSEVKVIDWLLDHALVDVAAYRLRPTNRLRVVGACNCGCASLFFNREALEGKIAMAEKGRLEMIADELAIYPEGEQAGLILWGLADEIVWLEVYDFNPNSSHRVPCVSNLCTWEELGRKSLKP
jgi:hypothetical protein